MDTFCEDKVQLQVFLISIPEVLFLSEAYYTILAIQGRWLRPYTQIMVIQ